MPVEKEYRFETEEGEKTLPELFDGRSQLLVYHFMFGPAYTAGCPTCSAGADTFDGGVVHLKQRDVTFLCASRAPLEKLVAYKRRMGWSFPWVSSHGSDFNFDFGVSFTDEQLREGAEYNYRLLEFQPILDAAAGTPFEALAASTGTHARGLHVGGARPSARSRSRTAPSTTRTRPTRAGSSSSSASTRSSTARRRAGTRAIRQSSGSAGTTSTRDA